MTLTSNHQPELSGIAEWLAGYSGISTAIIGSHSLKRAVEQRLKATGLGDTEVYLEHLLCSLEEQQDLVELVVVPETWFFRDRHPYVHLREHVGRMMQGGVLSQPLRLLSAPCATGEEPYSLAITLLDMGLPKEAFSIDAIDICRQSIRRARQAVYGKYSFRGVSEAEQQQHFQVSAQGLALDPAIRQTVHFRRANLMVALAELGTSYDVIFCRNLLIYLEEAASQHLLETMAGLIKPGGLLFVGSAETGKVPLELFESIREPFVFGYRRRVGELGRPPQPAVIESADHQPASLTTGPSVRDRSSAARAPRRPRTLRPPSPRMSPQIPSNATAPRGLTPTGVVERLAVTMEAGAPTELQRFQQELSRDPYSDATYLQLADWMLIHNRPQEALECLQKCLYLKPNSHEALKAIIQLTKKLGLIERSRQYQGRLARLEP
jgi:chemotaxis protein methyltransferase WspC